VNTESSTEKPASAISHSGNYSWLPKLHIRLQQYQDVSNMYRVRYTGGYWKLRVRFRHRNPSYMYHTRCINDEQGLIAQAYPVICCIEVGRGDNDLNRNSLLVSTPINILLQKAQPNMSG